MSVKWEEFYSAKRAALSVDEEKSVQSRAKRVGQMRGVLLS